MASASGTNLLSFNFAVKTRLETSKPHPAGLAGDRRPVVRITAIRKDYLPPLWGLFAGWPGGFSSSRVESHLYSKVIRVTESQLCSLS